MPYLGHAHAPSFDSPDLLLIQCQGTWAEASGACAAGVDDVDSYEELCAFIRTVSERSGVRHFIMHARKCLLSGLSPAQNRTVPPLRCAAGCCTQHVPAGATCEPHLTMPIGPSTQ